MIYLLHDFIKVNVLLAFTSQRKQLHETIILEMQPKTTLTKKECHLFLI